MLEPPTTFPGGPRTPHVELKYTEAGGRVVWRGRSSYDPHHYTEERDTVLESDMKTCLTLSFIVRAAVSGSVTAGVTVTAETEPPALACTAPQAARRHCRGGRGGGRRGGRRG